MYRCGECGLAVAVVPGKDPIRACPHTDAVIIAEASASLAGMGGLNVGTPQHPSHLEG